jgi:hypothetical protein
MTGDIQTFRDRCHGQSKALHDVEIRALDTGAAIRAARKSSGPPRAIVFRLVDPKGREVFLQINPTQIELARPRVPREKREKHSTACHPQLLSDNSVEVADVMGKQFVEIAYSPERTLEGIDVKLISSADRTIDVDAYVLTDTTVAQALAGGNVGILCFGSDHLGRKGFNR